VDASVSGREAKMRKLMILALLAAVLGLLAGCGAGNIQFIQTDDSYTPKPGPEGSKIVFRKGPIERPHRVIGVITAELGKKARRPELDALLVKKAREIGADGVMLVEYDVDRNVYLESHHGVVGRGPWRRHVVGRHRRVEVKKTASCIAVVFK
jgi:hypothetical protein